MPIVTVTCALLATAKLRTTMAIGQAPGHRRQSTVNIARNSIASGLLCALVLALAGCDIDSGHGKVMGSVNVAPGTPAADASTVNGAVHVQPGAQAADASTVNGAIDIGAGATVKDADTVNGSIRLAEKAIAQSATTVNGSIKLAAGAQVRGDATSVNGGLELGPGATVGGKLTNVNGSITVNDAHVGNGIETANGDIDIIGNAVVDGGLTVRKSKGTSFLGISFGSTRDPKIVIGPGATVNGPLVFERAVKLYISNHATVAGPITGATAAKFDGDQPPAQ